MTKKDLLKGLWLENNALPHIKYLWNALILILLWEMHSVQLNAFYCNVPIINGKKKCIEKKNFLHKMDALN